jgi:hypothetical protein
MSFYKLVKARTLELERPEKKLRTDYGESKRVDVAKYHDDLTKGKIKQNYDSIKSHHHDKLNHSDYLISQTNLGKTDLLKNKLLAERMAQLNATSYQPVQEVDINLGIGSSNAVVQEVNQVIGDFIQKISSGVFDLTMTNDLYKLYKLIQTQTYKFGSDLLERYKSYFEDVKDTLDLDETANVVRSYSRKDSSVLDLMIKIVNNSIQIINKMLEAIAKGTTSDERKQILEQDVKNISFKKIDTTYLKELSKEIKSIEEEIKTSKQDKMGGQYLLLQQQLDELQNIKKTMKDVEWNTKEPQEKSAIKFQEYAQNQEYEQMQRDQQEAERQDLLRQQAELERQIEVEKRKKSDLEEQKRRQKLEQEERERNAQNEKIDELRGKLNVLEKQNEIIVNFIDSLEGKYTSLRTEVLRLLDGKQQNKSNRLKNYRKSIEDGKENENFFNALKTKPEFLQLRQNIIEQLEYNRRLNAVQAEYIIVSDELDALERGGLPIEPEVMIDDKGVPEIKAEEADTVLDNLAEIFEADVDKKMDDTIKPVDMFEPMSIPNIKPKTDETMTEKPLYKTTEYTSTTNKITLLNGTDYFRNKEQFIEKQSKVALVNLLTKLNIDYSKWSVITKGGNETNVKAFRTKAFEVLKDNPRLKLKGGRSWFKE